MSEIDWSKVSEMDEETYRKNIEIDALRRLARMSDAEKAQWVECRKSLAGS